MASELTATLRQVARCSALEPEEERACDLAANTLDIIQELSRTYGGADFCNEVCVALANVGITPAGELPAGEVFVDV